MAYPVLDTSAIHGIARRLLPALPAALSITWTTAWTTAGTANAEPITEL
ncbi:hypothetical protein [Saccharothrix sp. ALI-22-I]|nr:hypothetical protein [Saccharothrix sp. ALI-22-I]